MRAALVIGAVLLALVCVNATPLDDYVRAPDSSYNWTDTGRSQKAPGVTYYILNMTSQTWLSRNDWHHDGRPGSPNIWFHFMLVAVPDRLLYPEHAFVYVTGGHNGVNNYPSFDDQDAIILSILAQETGAVGCALYQIPNQPLVFHDEVPQRSRSEDGMIAWTWRHFLKFPDQPNWLARLPMTKAVVRAMDTLTAYRRSKQNINKFIVAGASKRGWTTWTTAAVDKRVVAAVPLVMDELNFISNVHHHYRAYGGWSFALKDYYDLNFTLELDNPITQKMMDIIDPIVYKDRLTMPKFVVNAGGDEFFLPDDSRWWWDEMSDEKHFLMLPNAEHSLATGLLDLIPAVSAWANAILTNTPRHKFRWAHDDANGAITVTNLDSRQPRNVTLWYATTLPGVNRRDFRLVAGYPKPDLQLVLWFKQPVASSGPNTWIARVPRPGPGQWTAYFVDVQYDGPTVPSGKKILRSTTSVGIYPNTFPYPDCHGHECQGKLV